MKILIRLVMLSFILNTATACSQSNSKLQNTMEKDKKNNDESEILALTRRLTELMIARDTAGIDKIIDGDFTLTHITGYVQSKREWFAEIESESMKYFSYQEVSTSVEINEDSAIFIGKNLLDARIWGMQNKWRLQQTMQLKKSKGRWIILKSVAKTF